jgi:hypothetical protein
MINLIPPEAKKRIILEYWTRVVSVWGAALIAALIAGICIMVPTYVLITIQIGANESSSKAASEKVSEYETSTKELAAANQRAKAVVDSANGTLTSDQIHLIRSHESAEVVVSQITVNRAKDGFSPILVAGEARNRKALAIFRDELLAEPNVEAVDLPISNLAKDKDIQFNLSVTIKKS